MFGKKTVGLMCAGMVGASVALSSVAAHAQQVTTLGVYNDWAAYSMMENGKKVCYAASQPKKDEGNYTKRGDIYALITHRPDAKQLYVVTIYAGYAYRAGSGVQLSVDSTSFDLFTEGETAWADSEALDRRIVQAMRKGSNMVVKGTSARGTATRDTYSLRGVTAAVNKINEACSVDVGR